MKSQWDIKTADHYGPYLLICLEPLDLQKHSYVKQTKLKQRVIKSRKLSPFN